MEIVYQSDNELVIYQKKKKKKRFVCQRNWLAV